MLTQPQPAVSKCCFPLGDPVLLGGMFDATWGSTTARRARSPLSQRSRGLFPETAGGFRPTREPARGAPPSGGPQSVSQYRTAVNSGHYHRDNTKPAHRSPVGLLGHNSLFYNWQIKEESSTCPALSSKSCLSESKVVGLGFFLM